MKRELDFIRGEETIIDGGTVVIQKTRRSLLRTAAILAPVAALAACGIVSTSNTNGVTSVALSVVQVNAWGQAIANSALLSVGLPGIAGTDAATVIGGLASTASDDLTAFNTSTAGAVTLTFDAGSPPAAVASLLADGQKILVALSAAKISVPSAAVGAIQAYAIALTTIVSLFQAALASSATASAVMPSMTEPQALAVLKVR